MRSVLLPLCLASSLTGGPLALQSVLPPKAGCGTACRITIFTSGSLATPGDAESKRVLSNRKNWRVRAFEKAGKDFVEVPFGFSRAEAVKGPTGEFTVRLDFLEAQLKGKDPATLKWSVVFLGSGEFLAKTYYDASAAGPAAPTTALGGLKRIFTPAKGRDDADIYVSGSVLAGQGTKPIYMLDAKVNFAPPISRSGLRLGLYGEIQSNTGASPPNNRSSIDPDSITASATLNQLRKALYWELKPAGGEFSRKNSESNFVSSAALAWWPDAKRVPGGWFVFYPSIGIEGGKNLNKPPILFKQPVDFSRYNGIARVVPAMRTAYYVWGPKESPTVTVNGSYLARLLLTDEPFTTYEYYSKADGSRDRARFVHLRDNARHWVNAGITWNISDHLGLTAQYKYGSLPPLFELVSHQVSLGVALKSKLWERK